MLLAVVLAVVVFSSKASVLPASSSLTQMGKRIGAPLKHTIAVVLLSLSLSTSVYHEAAGAKPAIKIIAPGFIEPEWKIRSRVEQLRKRGFDVTFAYPRDRSVKARTLALVAALSDPDCENLVCVRGGFGTSDLLPYIPYEDLTTHKRVVGYSDISALLSALWTKNKFVGISGPMPWAVTWRIHTEEMRILLGVMNGEITTGNLPVKLQTKKDNPYTEETTAEGTLYGGDISVLTNLIGTPYMPDSLDGYILFFEGLYENTYRVIRYLNQWQQSGMLDGVQAIVLGRFDKLDGRMSDLYAKVAARVSFPVYTTKSFGHLRPLYPIPVGGYGRIAAGKLTWHLTHPENHDD